MRSTTILIITFQNSPGKTERSKSKRPKFLEETDISI